MICLSCTEKTLAKNIELISKNKKFLDLVEIRSDFLLHDELEKLKDFPAKINLPCILSFRLPRDGGVNTAITVEERDTVLINAIDSKWSFIDIEDDINFSSERLIIEKAEQNNTKIIKSFHNFTEVPKNLTNRMIKNSCSGRFIPKAAVMPKNSNDLIRLLKTHKDLSAFSNYILVGMGNYGLPSRIMACAWGSMLTYCSAGKIAAPGHISPKKMCKLYNFRNLSNKTRIFGIIGNPVLHSKSPKIHNKKFKKHKIDAVYLPFKTTKPEEIFRNYKPLNLYGLSVTSPFKQNVIDYLFTKDRAVTTINACNTMIKHSEGWVGRNTDWKGFLKPIEKHLLPDGILYNGFALVIGAGGAARAVVYALTQRNINVLIANRSVKKAEEIASTFGVEYSSLDNISKTTKVFDIVIQTTSVGMNPEHGKTPVPGFNFKNVKIAYDLIYSPKETKFLREAKKAGCKIINGKAMLEAQAKEQFKLFSKIASTQKA